MLLAALPIFFISGVAALAYQVAWQRMLVMFSGADVHSATIVVAAFMAGLGCGSAAGGYVADRVSRLASLRLFALAELSVSFFGVVSPALFYNVLYQRFGGVDLGLGATSAILILALLWPTFFMGASLPLLARGLTDNVAGAAHTIGWLYGVNTIGAATGALVTTFVLLPSMGMVASVRVAASLNVLCGVLAVVLVRVRARQTTSTPATTAESLRDRADVPLSFTSWAALFAVAGFIALSLEIVWFRMLGVMLKSTSFTFGTLLALYLSGIGLGATAGGAYAARIRRPALGFFVTQAAAGIYAAVSLIVIVGAVRPGHWLSGLATYFGGYDAIDVRAVVLQLANTFGAAVSSAGSSDSIGMFARLYVVLPAVLFGPPTFLAGFSFPLLQKAVQTDLQHVGRRTGALLTANIVGSTVGTFLTGWVLLDWLGTPRTLLLLFILSLGFGFLGVQLWARGRSAAARWLAVGSLLVIGLAIGMALPGRDVLWSRFHGAEPRSVIAAEDGSGLALLKAEDPNFRRVVVYVNGLGQSWIPYGNIHTVLGALPAFVHPNPKSAVVIGLGSGDTLFGVAGRPEFERITSIEIIEPQVATLREFGQISGYPGVTGILNDPRITHVFGDGRLFLRRSGKRFDIIEADALRPTSAYSGNLYSDAYFELLRDHLNPGGLAVTWAPTARVQRTFNRVFPYVWRHQQVMMGSDRPIVVNRGAVLERLRQEQVAAYFAGSRVDIEALVDPYLTGPWSQDGQSREIDVAGDINTDLFPRDEFNLRR